MIAIYYRMKFSMIDLTIVIPAIDEAQNIGSLISDLDYSAKNLGIQYEILVMDGGSRDGTQKIAAEASGAVKVVRQNNKGYGGALAEGFALAKGEYILTIDADLSHDPSFLTHFWASRNQGEMIIGSRYVPGGAAIMPFARKFLSRMLNLLFRKGLSMPWQDLSSGFRLYRSLAVKSLKLKSFEFDCLQEILIRIHSAGWKVAEIPIL
jgi:dolichol-phosphate mannosyltransferase